jgi:ubiquinone/menaquinone biosynthesis C-methylase UbiE
MSSPLAHQEPWDLVAEGYEKYFLQTSADFSRRAAELLDLEENASRILDVACGPGTTVSVLADIGHEIDAIDFSDHMIGRLRARLAEARLGKSTVRTQVMDGQNLQFANDTFDAAVSMFGLIFFPDRARGFEEMLRVLKPGAKACVSSWLPFAEVPAMKWMFGALQHVSPLPTDNAAPREPVLEDPEVFREELRRAGFVDVEVIRHDTVLPVTSPLEFWDAMAEASAPVAMLRKQLGEAGWAEVSPRAQQYLAETAPKDLSTLTLSAWLGSGRKPTDDH